MSECTAIREQFEDRLCGTLPPEEEAALEVHLDRCPACRGAWEDFRALSRMLSGERDEILQVLAAPKGLADRILDAIEGEAAPYASPHPRETRGIGPLAILGSWTLTALVTIVYGALFYLFFGKVGLFEWLGARLRVPPETEYLLSMGATMTMLGWLAFFLFSISALREEPRVFPLSGKKT
jgi:anti-sigma factor RsiW